MQLLQEQPAADVLLQASKWNPIHEPRSEGHGNEEQGGEVRGGTMCTRVKHPQYAAHFCIGCFLLLFRCMRV